ncbi:hypothetical protein SODALDRAFT_51123 [Sodiomyces alkalinus F11]|uniref:Prokaryotic-type class I peptide chain release factors domain-containing protein n=1 Tax=Sodiomyces alkalinus (strain CBS 110278 / VKM F-3762 / F11) TaxID=1314773 RepID=A0A3N2PMX2_SODAK|nr:hypothetical protein SODALDRAFT_51123 [Sodiomyces alkalinus F11]ROT35780.1 hypothetical protein SODALDRAFT_51123 [Sodiomyces alkalinus F11]
MTLRLTARASLWTLFRLGGTAVQPPLAFIRSARFQAFDTSFDADELREARAWHQAFDETRLPKGQTSFARSSGPGGQHVNKTETKAITTWPVKDLIAVLPKLLHPGVRASKYYTARTDCLTIQDQTHRQRSANTDENFRKLVEEVQRIYQERVPNESSPAKQQKYIELERTFHKTRLQQKKNHSSKKQGRRGPSD